MTRDQEAILALTADNERLRELLREAQGRMAWSPENMQVARRIDAALGEKHD